MKLKCIARKYTRAKIKLVVKLCFLTGAQWRPTLSSIFFIMAKQIWKIIDIFLRKDH